VSARSRLTQPKTSRVVKLLTVKLLTVRLLTVKLLTVKAAGCKGYFSPAEHCPVTTRRKNS